MLGVGCGRVADNSLIGLETDARTFIIHHIVDIGGSTDSTPF